MFFYRVYSVIARRQVSEKGNMRMEERSRLMSRVWLVIIILAGVGSVTFAHMMAIPALVYMVLSGAAPKGETSDDSYLRVRVAKADDTTARISVGKCVDAIKYKIPDDVINSWRPVCELITPIGVTVGVEIFLDEYRAVEILSSTINNMIYMKAESEDGDGDTKREKTTEKFVLEAVIPGVVFKVFTEYYSVSGEALARFDKSSGGGGQYVINGGLDAYYVRCNRSPYDNCVLFVDPTYPPYRSFDLDVPPRLRRVGLEEACTVILNFSFIEPADPRDLQGIVDVVEMTIAHPEFNTGVRPEIIKHCKNRLN
jgi:hypothetical protein